MIGTLLSALLLAASLLAGAATAEERGQVQEEARTFNTILAEPEAWPAGTWAGWKGAFLSADGRVIDNANGEISHSEGQGYGLLLAVLANDRTAFDAMWTWTRNNLRIRPDHLAAWKWEPKANPNVTDRNNATDGDLLIAWALLEASERWAAPALAAEAGKIVADIDRLTGARSAVGRVLMPAAAGFSAKDREKEGDGPVVNPSYWIFPALERLPAVAPKIDWAGYRASGLTLLKLARFGAAGLSTEWVSLKGRDPAQAAMEPRRFSYNAVRIPLYLAWSRGDTRALLQPYLAHYAQNQEKVYEYDPETNANTAEMADPGYKAVFAFAKCVAHGEQIARGLRSVSFDRYYSATLHMLALAAARLRSDKCLSERL